MAASAMERLHPLPKLRHSATTAIVEQDCTRAGFGVIWGNSALDARPFSLSGQNTPKAHYNQVTGVVTFGGPLNIPYVFHTSPTFFVGYQWTRNRDADTDSALVPDTLEREGISLMR